MQSDVLRRVVPFRDMLPEMRQATVAIEDERFYKHEGVDFNAIIRAGIKNLESGKTVQGRLHHHPAARARALHP